MITNGTVKSRWDISRHFIIMWLNTEHTYIKFFTLLKINKNKIILLFLFIGLSGESNPRPLVPKVIIMPLDH